MKAIQLIAHGSPETACQCVNLSEPGPPQANEIKVAIKASAINPADILIFEGRYPGPDSLPAQVGIEGAGVVTQIGSDVTDFAVGDHVLSLGRCNWAETVMDDAGRFIPIDKNLSWQDAAQLKANPPSAFLMLTDYVDLQPGDWVIQNAANSAVGRHVVSFCKTMGLRSINVVRRESLAADLKLLGADCVIVDPEPAQPGSFNEKVREHTGMDANIRLGIDAIGGKASAKLADCLSEGGTVVNYGFLSGDACELTSYHTIIHNLTLKGFWLVGFMQRSQREEVIEMYRKMSQAFIDGDIGVPVEAEYSLEEISKALAHAATEQRNGKIILRPDQ